MERSSIGVLPGPHTGTRQRDTGIADRAGVLGGWEAGPMKGGITPKKDCGKSRSNGTNQAGQKAGEGMDL